MLRIALLTTAALTVLAAPAFAADPVQDEVPVQSAFSKTIGAIKDWFGTPDPKSAQGQEQPADTQIPEIEPAAGDELLQVPPPYTGPQSSNTVPAGHDRATAFDTASSAAFGDNMVVALADIAPAAGEGEAPVIDCKAIAGAVKAGQEPDTALVEACDTQTDASGEPVMDPAQPALEDLPVTQPAAGEPPIGEAVMPGQPQ